MSLTCYIVDDELHSIEVIRQYILKTEGLELVGFSTNPLEAINAVTGANSPDITFLDVEMPELSGLEFAGLVNMLTTVIFITSFREYALEAYRKEAFDYLVKPITYPVFLKCIYRIRRLLLKRGDNHTIKDREFFFVQTDTKGKIEKVIIQDIVYVGAAQNYVQIFFDNSKIMPYLTMTEVQELLPSGQFIRIHRSFIINDKRIKTVEHGKVCMDNKVALAIGRNYKSEFLERIQENTVKSKRKS